MHRFTLFVPGTPKTLKEWTKLLAKSEWKLGKDKLSGPKLEVGAEWIANDGTFGDAFAYTASDEERATIGAAGSALVLYVEEPLDTARTKVLAMVDALMEAGALAIRIEQSKLGYPIAQWRKLLKDKMLHRLAVIVLSDEGSFTSCGMHIFARADVNAPTQDLVTVFNEYHLHEDPIFLTGDTFAPGTKAKKHSLERWPDMTYGSDHPCHNPYGVWHLQPTKVKSKGNGQTFVFVPALHAVLLAAEQQKGKKLTQKQVEAIVDEASCMSMEPKDAREMERSRGYADIEPERAWEAWQIIQAMG